MARGTVIGEPVVSQANSAAFDEGYDRVFGKDRQPVRGRWVYDPVQQKCVPADEYQPPERAINAPIMMDRFYEGVRATDGTDIGSRRKHRQYMKDHGLTTADDFKGEWAKAKAKRDDMKAGKWHDPRRREVLERAFWKINGKP
jgi:hypothetical protein